MQSIVSICPLPTDLVGLHVYGSRSYSSPVTERQRHRSRSKISVKCACLLYFHKKFHFVLVWWLSCWYPTVTGSNTGRHPRRPQSMLGELSGLQVVDDDNHAPNICINERARCVGRPGGQASSVHRQMIAGRRPRILGPAGRVGRRTVVITRQSTEDRSTTTARPPSHDICLLTVVPQVSNSNS